MEKKSLPNGLLLRATIVAAVFFSTYSWGQENYTQWLHYKDIVINTSSTGYDISENLVNFPYLLRLFSTDIPFNQAKKNGEDIRFANASGVHLAYEIEKWDSSGQSAVVWVRVDSIRSSNATQYIRMHWGRTAAFDSSKSTVVFQTTNNFVAAWHFASDALSDATANVNTGTDNGTMLVNDTIGTPGFIGNCRSFGGGYINFGNKTCFQIASQITVYGWLKSSMLNGWASIIRHDGHFTALQVDGADNCHIALWNPNLTMNATWTWSDGWNNGAWHFFATRFHTTNGVTVFRDSAVYYTNAAVTGTLATTTTAPFVVGGSETGGETYSGYLDEVVVSNVARSNGWLKLCYLNQRLVINNPPTINYPVKELTVAYGGILSSVVPVVTGIVDSLTISPSTFPDYLVFNTTTGAISGWAQQLMARTAYYVRVYNVKGFDEDTVYLTVYDPTSVSDGALKTGNSKNPVFLGVSTARQPVINFSVPSPAAVQSLQFRMYDCSGVCIWSRSVAGTALRAGRCSMQIGNPPPGVYITEMKCTGIDGRVSKISRSSIIP